MPDERLAALIPPRLWTRLTSMPLSLTIDALRPGSVVHRSLIANPGTTFYVDPEHVVVRDLEGDPRDVALRRALARVLAAA